jgi:hypothetical protein
MLIFKFLDHHKELLTLLLATVGGAFALWRWLVDRGASSMLNLSSARFLRNKARLMPLKFLMYRMKQPH